MSCRKNSPTPKTVSSFVPRPGDNPTSAAIIAGRCWIHCARALRAAWRYGDWYAAVEGLVYANFAPDNVTLRGPDGVRPEIAVDDGYIDQAATLFMQKLSDGGILVFR